MILAFYEEAQRAFLRQQRAFDLLRALASNPQGPSHPDDRAKAAWDALEAFDEEPRTLVTDRVLADATAKAAAERVAVPDPQAQEEWRKSQDEETRRQARIALEELQRPEFPHDEDEVRP